MIQFRISERNGVPHSHHEETKNLMCIRILPADPTGGCFYVLKNRNLRLKKRYEAGERSGKIRKALRFLKSMLSSRGI